MGNIHESIFCDVFNPDGPFGNTDFSPPLGRWDHGDLSFSIETLGCRFDDTGHPMERPETVIRSAFQQWQQASVGFFSFREVPSGASSDIPVTFEHFKSGPIQGTGGEPGSGFVKLRNDRTWNHDALLNAMLHEIGHCLGLGHAFGSSIMNEGDAGVTVDPSSKAVLFLMYHWRLPKRLEDRGTSDHAVLAVADFGGPEDIPVMVWKGDPGDAHLYYSELHGERWSDQEQIPGRVASSHSPALVTLEVPLLNPQTGLLMAWKGKGDDKHLYWTRKLDQGWEERRDFPSALSDTRPALASVSGHIYLACVGSDGDRQLYWSNYDGSEDWSKFEPIRDFRATESPALVGVRDTLYMFWRSDNPARETFWSKIDLKGDQVWTDPHRLEYTFHDFPKPEGGKPRHPIFAGGAFSAAVCGDTILLAWKGDGGDNATYVTVFAEDSVGSPIPIKEFRTSVGPSLTYWDNGMLIAWQGPEDDHSIYWSRI